MPAKSRILPALAATLVMFAGATTSFAQELTKGGIDGLITTLVERNKTAAK